MGALPICPRPPSQAERAVYQLPFLKLWHRGFALRIREAAAGVEPLAMRPEDVADPAACRLGRWIAAHRGTIELELPLNELQRCHETFHRTGDQLLQANLSRDPPFVIDACRGQMAVASAAVTTGLDWVEAKARRCGLLPPAERGPECFWSDAWNVGIPIIDTQHQAIATLAAKIARHPEAALNSELGVDFLLDFHQLIAEHFDTEERVMQAMALPEGAQQAHVEEHSMLLAKIASYAFDRTSDDGPKYVAELMSDLGEIIVGHVLKYDFTLKSFSG